jgi:hypothetical protein
MKPLQTPTDEIARWYDSKRDVLYKAQQLLEDAIKHNAPREEIERLMRNRDDAGDVGD